MSQLDDDLDQVIGYVLKQAQSALRARMDEALRPVGLTAPQYACMELLSRTPGMSNSDLAGGAFVTRQTMNSVLRGLQGRGLVVRVERAPSGRARPTSLSDEGARLLAEASELVNAIDKRMVDGLSVSHRRDLHRHLRTCIAALEGDA